MGFSMLAKCTDNPGKVRGTTFVSSNAPESSTSLDRLKFFCSKSTLGPQIYRLDGSTYQYGGRRPAKFEVMELSPLSSFFLWPVNYRGSVNRSLFGAIEVTYLQLYMPVNVYQPVYIALGLVIPVFDKQSSKLILCAIQPLPS